MLGGVPWRNSPNSKGLFKRFIMVYKIQDRLQHNRKRFKEVNCELVKLTRGSESTVDIVMSPILLIAEEATPGLGITRIEPQDFCVDVADYQILSIAVVPQEGDMITRDTGEVFILQSQDQLPVYSFTTSTRDRYRLYTKRTKV